MHVWERPVAEVSSSDREDDAKVCQVRELLVSPNVQLYIIYIIMYAMLKHMYKLSCIWYVVVSLIQVQTHSKIIPTGQLIVVKADCA